MFYLPLLEPHAKMEQDDDDFLEDNEDELRDNLVVPFKKSVLQIIREVSLIFCLILYRWSFLLLDILIVI